MQREKFLASLTFEEIGDLTAIEKDEHYSERQRQQAKILRMSAEHQLCAAQLEEHCDFGRDTIRRWMRQWQTEGLYMFSQERPKESPASPEEELSEQLEHTKAQLQKALERERRLQVQVEQLQEQLRSISVS
jgi:transposase